MNRSVRLRVLPIVLLISLSIVLSGCTEEIEISPEDVTIGYIGCSNTRETVEGYFHAGGERMWPYEKRYDSGSVKEWAGGTGDRKYWKVFDDLLQEYPQTKTIWWELCIPDNERETSYEQTETILKEIRTRIPGATIYVSPLADYTDGVCSITGTWGLEKAKELAQQLDANHNDVLLGPTLGPMTSQDTAKDGCHLSNSHGKRKLGNQLRLFLDADEYSSRDTSIGYVGCSNTMQTVAAYWLEDSSKNRTLWTFKEDDLHEYDGGAVIDWSKSAAKGNKFWKTFDHYFKKSPNTNAVFWQLCIRKEEPTPYEEALIVLNAIRERIPNATIYVSPLPPYTEGICEITGVEGIERAKNLAQELAAQNEDVVPGPMLGPMRPEDTREDGCHLSEQGMQTLGKQMREFFDTALWTPPSNTSPEITAETETKKTENEEQAILDTQKQSITSTTAPEEELSPEEKAWRSRIDAALVPTSCPDLPATTFPSTYYQGPLTDTHLHIPAIPDWAPEEDAQMAGKVPEGRFGGPQALLGWNVKMSQIACTLKHEGTQKNFAFFPVYEGEMSLRLLEIWNKSMTAYPEQFAPFIMSSGNDGEPNGFPTVDATTLQEMLAVYPGLFEGYGEIGLYARENGGSPELPPDSTRLQEIYPLARKNNLVVYFHLGDGHKEKFEKVLKDNPDLTFIWHGDQLTVEEVSSILEKYPHAYYGIDEFFGGEREIFELYVGESKEQYLQTAEKNFDQIVQQAVSHWKQLIEEHPNQVLWGTDRGDAVWNYDVEVGQMQVKIARAFIGKLNPEVQEKFAYKNAQKLLVIKDN